MRLDSQVLHVLWVLNYCINLRFVTVKAHQAHQVIVLVCAMFSVWHWLLILMYLCFCLLTIQSLLWQFGRKSVDTEIINAFWNWIHLLVLCVLMIFLLSRHVYSTATQKAKKRKWDTHAKNKKECLKCMSCQVICELTQAVKVWQLSCKLECDWHHTGRDQGENLLFILWTAIKVKLLTFFFAKGSRANTYSLLIDVRK